TSSITFTVRLPYATVLPVTIDYATSDGTATVTDGDYGPASGTLAFAPGEVAKVVTIAVNGDLKPEGDESFSVNLVNPANASIAPGGHLGIGVIRDDDSGGAMYYVNDASTAGDVFTTAPGNNANDGKTPATPVASLTGLLSLYQFHPGDTIYVDA